MVDLYTITKGFKLEKNSLVLSFELTITCKF